MKFAKLWGLMVVVLGMLIPAHIALASQGNGNSEQPKAAKPQKDDKDKDKKVVRVPEPTTIALLGAAAGVAGARKLWQKRRRSKSV